MKTATATAGLKYNWNLQAVHFIGAPFSGGVMGFPQRGHDETVGRDAWFEAVGISRSIDWISRIRVRQGR